MLTNTHRRELLTVKETAARLGLHPMTIRRKIERGEIPAVQLGGPGTSIRIVEAELDLFIYGSDVTRLEQEILAASERGDTEELERLRTAYRRVGVLERPVSLLKVEERDG
jgi:excisionase family DNA binding protein